MMKESEALKELNNYPKIKEVMSFFEPTEQFKYLLGLNGDVPIELYAYYARAIYQCDTDEVENNLIIEVFNGLTKEMLMTDKELDFFRKLPEKITIYRGTNDDEKVPRFSWSLNRNIANRFNQGRLFTATVKKADIIAYFEDAGEEEIVMCLSKECFFVSRW